MYIGKITMSFFSSLFSKKSIPVVSEEALEINPNVKAALALMKISETGKHAVDSLKKHHITLTQDVLPCRTAHFPEKNTLTINSSLSPADIAVALTGAARRIEHEKSLPREALTKLRCADGLKCVRAGEADAQAYEAMTYHDLASAKLPGFTPSPVDSPAVTSVMIGKAAGQTKESLLKNAVIAFYNDDSALKKADKKYIQEMMSGAMYYIHHGEKTAFSQKVAESAFDKICSTDGKPYMPEGFFAQPQSNFVQPEIRKEIDYQANRYAKFVQTTPDTSITFCKSRAEAFAATRQAVAADKANRR